jgi:hypothetical protein
MSQPSRPRPVPVPSLSPSRPVPSPSPSASGSGSGRHETGLSVRYYALNLGFHGAWQPGTPPPHNCETPVALVPIEWAGEQFRALGRPDAHELAVNLIAAYEGGALLANTFRDPGILTRGARRLTDWIDTL